jgi:lysophospholipase L1-like esterase
MKHPLRQSLLVSIGQGGLNAFQTPSQKGDAYVHNKPLSHVPTIKVPAPWPSLYTPLVDDSCDSLTGWTVTGTADLSRGKFRLSGANAGIHRALTFPTQIPFLLSADVYLTYASTAISALKLTNGSDISIVSLGVQTFGKNRLSLNTPAGGNQRPKSFIATGGIRVYLLFDPIYNIARGWFSDIDGFHYIGEVATVGTPAYFGVNVGPKALNDMLLDDIIVTPMYAVCMGDSRVEGFPGHSPWPGMYGGYDDPTYSVSYNLYKIIGAYVVNAGQNGFDSTQNRIRFADHIVKFKPKVVILSSSNFGTEDVATFTSNNNYMANLATTNGIKVIFVELPPCEATLTARYLAYNTWLAAYCKEKGYPLIKIYDLLSNGADKLAAPYNSGDDVHLTNKGYQYIAQLISEVIKK